MTSVRCIEHLFVCFRRGEAAKVLPKRIMNLTKLSSCRWAKRDPPSVVIVSTQHLTADSTVQTGVWSVSKGWRSISVLTAGIIAVTALVRRSTQTTIVPNFVSAITEVGIRREVAVMPSCSGSVWWNYFGPSSRGIIYQDPSTFPIDSAEGSVCAQRVEVTLTWPFIPGIISFSNDRFLLCLHSLWLLLVVSLSPVVSTLKRVSSS